MFEVLPFSKMPSGVAERAFVEYVLFSRYSDPNADVGYISTSLVNALAKMPVGMKESLFDDVGSFNFPWMDLLPTSSPPDKRSSLDLYDEDGHTALMKAVKRMDVHAVRSLLKDGANTKVKDEGFGTAAALSIAKLALMRVKLENERNRLKKIIEIFEPIT